MKEYVDVEVLKQQDFQDFSNSDVMHAIDHCPRADVEPVRHAHWIRKPYFPDGTPAWVCSRCGRPEADEEPYCNCGAKMDGKE